MLGGFLSDAMNFQNVEGSFGQNVLLSAVRNTVAAEAFSDFAATMQLQWYNHSCVIMGTIRLLAERQLPPLDSMRLYQFNSIQFIPPSGNT